MGFIQPVSMKCSREQYERDLKAGLLQMGYKEKQLDCTFENLVNNLNGSIGAISNISNTDLCRWNRYYISEYNPELFLALCAITHFDTGITGEWWYCICNGSQSAFKEGGLYKQISNNIFNYGSFINDKGGPDGWNTDNLSYFRKATSEEIINHLKGKMKKAETKIIKKEDFEKLYNISCPKWRDKFDDYLKPYMFKAYIEFDLDFLLEMQSACLSNQLPIFKEIFGEISDGNAFVEKADLIALKETSRKLFGNIDIMQIAKNSALKINRPDLAQKSILFNTEVEVIVHKIEGSGTLLEIRKK
jgi:hypothetical protein